MKPLEDGDHTFSSETASEATMFAIDDLASSMPPSEPSSNPPDSPTTSSKKKEQRTYRVGLSYACKRCGQPKKGHKCTAGAAPADGPPEGSAAKPTEKKRPAKENAKSTPDGAKTEKGPCPKRPRKEAAKDEEEAGSQGDTIEEVPSQDLCKPVGAEDAVRLAELLEFNQPLRPPSLITPEDVEAPVLEAALALSSMSAPPASLASASNVFSPDQFMVMMGTPAPAITPGLHFQRGISPGSLNALAAAPMASSGLTTSAA